MRYILIQCVSYPHKTQVISWVRKEPALFYTCTIMDKDLHEKSFNIQQIYPPGSIRSDGWGQGALITERILGGDFISLAFVYFGQPLSVIFTIKSKIEIYNHIQYYSYSLVFSSTWCIITAIWPSKALIVLFSCSSCFDLQMGTHTWENSNISAL